MVVSCVCKYNLCVLFLNYLECIRWLILKYNILVCKICDDIWIPFLDMISWLTKFIGCMCMSHFITPSIFFQYIFVINGLELIKLARDCIKFVTGRGQSARLKRAMYKWVQLYKNIIEKKEVIKNGLEKACTSGFDPYFFRGFSRHNLKSTHE